ncbi:MAG: hypothetical protein JXA99_08980, partial [Candidatus Lokiarchaeota archaeon]|nr:hypothetical protein [Candidatus Lokiarchaeota archaeon]
MNKKSIYTISFIFIFLLTTIPINNQIKGISKEIDSEPISYLDEEPKSAAIVNDDESYLYVIVTSDALNNSGITYSFQDLLESKLHRGIYGKIVTVEDIFSSYGGRDHAEKIRNFIVDAYNRWETRYVLLGGDSDIIPPRYFCPGLEPDHPWISDEHYYYSDHYYATMHNDWDHDNDGVYGEYEDWEGLALDERLGEVYIGRAPVGSISEVNNFVKKTIIHEQELTSRIDNDYLYSGCMVGEFIGFEDYEGSVDEGPIVPVGPVFGADYLDQLYMFDENEYYNDYGYQTRKIPDDYTFQTLYERERFSYPTLIHWNTNDLINIIEGSNGMHIINHYGAPIDVTDLDENLVQDNPDALKYILHDNLMRMDINDVVNLENDKYFFLFAAQDYAFNFANEIDQNYQSDFINYNFLHDSIGERFITSPSGAFATIGAIESSLPTGWQMGEDPTNTLSQMLYREFYDAIFREGIEEIGRALQDAKEELLARFEYIDNIYLKELFTGWEIFGDPMARIRPKEQSIFDDHGSYNYLIITNEYLENSYEDYNLQDFINYKTNQGYYTKIETIENIRAEYDYLSDDQEKIRAFLQDAYSRWDTRYVLLCGDDTIIPMREFQSPLINDRYTDDDYLRSFPSDQYYASLDCSWDEDMDGIYGEEKDWNQYLSINNKIQIAVGRAPVSSTRQLSNFVRKTLLHEQEMIDDNNDFYLYNVLNVAERLDNINFAGDQLDHIIYDKETSGYCNFYNYQTKQIEDYYSVESLYDRDDYPDHDWNKEEFISKITSEHGVHIINYDAHGFPDKMMKMSISEVDSIKNTKNFFIYSSACEIFAVHQGDTIGEHWMNSNNGAFAMIGNIGLGLYMFYGEGPSNNYLREFYDAIFRENIDEIGLALQDAKRDALNLDNALLFKKLNFNAWKYIFLSLNFFGDPSIIITQDSTPADLVPHNNINIALDDVEVLDDGNVTFAYRLSSGISNIGEKRAEDSYSRFGLWGDAGMYYLGEPYYTDRLNPNEHRSITYEGTIKVPLGEYRIFHDVNIYNDVYESEDGNNFMFDSDPLILDPANFFSDIMSGDIEMMKSNVTLGDNEVTFSYDISSDIINTGLLSSNNAFWVQYFAKSDESVYELGKYYIENLEPKNIITANCSGTITLPFGEYEIVCSVDNNANVDETDETNNIYNDFYPLIVSNDILLPDLTVCSGYDAEFNVKPLCIRSGIYSAFEIYFFYEMSFDIKNYGWETNEDFKILCYLESGNNNGISDFLIGEYNVNGLKQNEIITIQDEGYLSIPFGHYYLRIKVDSSVLISESNENNNYGMSFDEIIFSIDDLAPDYAVVGSIESEINDITSQEGGDITFSFNLSTSVFNYGFDTYQRVKIDYYLIEGENEYYLGYVNDDDLSYLGNNLFLGECQGKVTVPFGKYELKCIIDDNNQVIELDETNNIYIDPNPIINVPGCTRINDVEDKILGEIFDTKVYINSGTQRVAAYGFNITFNPNIVNIERITAGIDGFLSAIEIDNSNGWATACGFDATGMGPSSCLDFLTITWEAIGSGETILGIEIIQLLDETTDVIGTPHGVNSHVIINPLPNRDVTISPVSDKTVGDRFTTHVYIDSGDQRIAAYGFNFTFDSNIVNIQQITAGPDGFISATEIDN